MENSIVKPKLRFLFAAACVMLALCLSVASAAYAAGAETRQEKLGSFTYRIWEDWTAKTQDERTVYYYDETENNGRVCICMLLSLGEYSSTEAEGSAEIVLSRMVEGMMNDADTSLETAMIDIGDEKAMRIQGRLAGSNAAGVLVLKDKEIFAMVLLGEDDADLLTLLLSLAEDIE